MDGLAVADLRGILAPLNFTAPMAEKPYSYNYEPPLGVPVRNTSEETHEIKILDARAVGDRLSLDREGFVLLRYPTAAKDLYDEAEISSVYYPECARIVKEATGAARVHVFDHIVRNAARMAKGSPIKGYAGRVHNDYTAWSAPQRVRDLMGNEAEALLKHRYAEINVWRPIRGPLLRSPLALCATTLSEENLVGSELRYPDRTGETYVVTYNPGQRWYYFPEMTSDEVVLIRCFDSAREGAARFSAHGAFDDPSTPPDAPPRESIEVRTLVFFD
ncbi:MAG: methyltransferase [Alphaproteobacteria bacterium]|nr:methyltransferase [Alphaproteobacteria bacterium]MBV9154097.1 methyltransferase [Alphaproteobacteria bacterium]